MQSELDKQRQNHSEPIGNSKGQSEGEQQINETILELSRRFEIFEERSHSEVTKMTDLTKALHVSFDDEHTHTCICVFCAIGFEWDCGEIRANSI